MSKSHAPINPEDLRHLLDDNFSRFRKLMLDSHDAERQQYYGVALGLLIAQHVAGLMVTSEFDVAAAKLGDDLQGRT